MTKGFVYISEAMNHARQGHPDGWVIVESSDKMWSTGGGNGQPLQYSCLENSMDRGAWWAKVHGGAKSWTQLSNCGVGEDS